MKVRSLEGVVPAVFDNRQEAEAAAEELRRLGFADDDLGVVVPDPQHYHLLDNSTREALGGVASGGVVGIPIGVLAGLGIAALIAPGLGAIGLGGALLAGGIGGAVWGAYLGSEVGLAARIGHISEVERRYEIPLQPNEILLVVLAGNQSAQVCETLEAHGARCLWEERDA
jgi:hypothetical protein